MLLSRNAPTHKHLHSWSTVLLASIPVLLLVRAASGLEFSHPNRLTNKPIVVVHDPGATHNLQPQPDRVNLMVERAMTELTGAATPEGAWRTLVNSNDVVAIKVFSAPDPSTGTQTTVATAVIRGLLSARVANSNIIIWDRSETDLRKAGYGKLADSMGVTLGGAVQAGYTEDDSYEFALVTGLRFGDLEFGKTGEGVGRRSFVTKLLGPRVTKIISIAPASNKHSTGVTGHLYSMTLGSVDNTWRFESNPTTLPWALPEIFAMRSIGDRVVLYITDALICQYEGEEATLLHYSKVANELYVGTDPVAMDLRAIRLLEKERESSHSLRIQPNLDMYRNAALLQLGVDDPDRIAVKRISLDTASTDAPEFAPTNRATVQP